jgi:hypothetical protein
MRLPARMSFVARIMPPSLLRRMFLSPSIFSRRRCAWKTMGSSTKPSLAEWLDGLIKLGGWSHARPKQCRSTDRERIARLQARFLVGPMVATTPSAARDSQGTLRRRAERSG